MGGQEASFKWWIIPLGLTNRVIGRLKSKVYWVVLKHVAGSFVCRFVSWVRRLGVTRGTTHYWSRVTQLVLWSAATGVLLVLGPPDIYVKLALELDDHKICAMISSECCACCLCNKQRQPYFSHLVHVLDKYREQERPKDAVLRDTSSNTPLQRESVAYSHTEAMVLQKAAIYPSEAVIYIAF